MELIRRSPVCLYAGTYLDAAVLAYCPAGAELVDTQELDLDVITATMVTADAAGHDVARLCSGDPSVYSALREQTRRLDAHGVSWDVTPGVPAYAAAAARLGVELTVPEVAQSVVLTRTQARSTKMPETESLADFARTRATLVLHLAITRIGVLAEELTGEYGADCPGRRRIPGQPARRTGASGSAGRDRRDGGGRRAAAGGGDPGGAGVG